jgi:UDP-N-acetylglucosamine 1-carboxyvinyltransferase
MARLTIRGGNPLQGRVTISGSKNSALAVLAAVCLADGESVLENIPHGTAILTMCLILRQLGAVVFLDKDERLHIDASAINQYKAPYDLVRRERGSFYVAGLLLGRLGRAEVPLPGGCAIGSRPVDFHIRGFSALGADVSIEHGYMKAHTRSLQGTTLYVGRQSVGTTINLMIAAAQAEGVTVLENAGKEPEVVDVAILLNSMGAHIRGAGTDVIRIEGVSRLQPVTYSIISDRIEAGTFMMCTAMAGGEVLIENVVPEHLRSPIMKLTESGVSIEEHDSSLWVRSEGRIKATDVETAPYPGFPTDLQQPFVSVLSTADGTSVVRENIFDRFRYVDELRRMGADIRVERDTAIVRGVEKLTGAPVEVTDLRAGAALVVAGLGASGETHVHGAEHIERGYEHFTDKLRALGADIEHDDALPALFRFYAGKRAHHIDQ